MRKFEPIFPFEGERKRFAKILMKCLSLVSLFDNALCNRFVLLVFFFELFRDISRVLFVRWFRRPFFEQVVYAVVVLVIPSSSDVYPLVKRRFRLFD